MHSRALLNHQYGEQLALNLEPLFASLKWTTMGYITMVSVSEIASVLIEICACFRAGSIGWDNAAALGRSVCCAR